MIFAGNNKDVQERRQADVGDLIAVAMRWEGSK
jgi:hypothetical protein